MLVRGHPGPHLPQQSITLSDKIRPFFQLFRAIMRPSNSPSLQARLVIALVEA
jgi:hypothetical protein